MADFIINPAYYFATANQPRTITVKPAKKNTGEQITKRLKITAPGFKDKYITLVQRAAPTKTP